MQDKELPKNMGKKIVDALKQQDFEDSVELNSENSIDEFDANDDISLDELSDSIKEKIGDYYYNLLPNSFFQLNPLQAKVLYDEVKKASKLLLELDLIGRKSLALNCNNNHQFFL